MDITLLHGGGQGGWIWDETVAALHALPGAAQQRVLALDVPGCGAKRGRDTTALTVDAIADELLADIRAAGFRQVLLAGHSLAGTLLPRMAERAPELIARLVFVSCLAPPAGRTIGQVIGQGLHGARPDEVGWPLDPATTPKAELYRAMFCNDMDAATADAFLARLFRDRWPDAVMTATDWRYAHLAGMRVAFVICERDGILPAPWQELFAARVHADRVPRIDAGHQVMNTQPAALAALLLAEAARG